MSSKFKVIPCPNCNGTGTGSGPGFSNPGLFACVEPSCKVCSTVQDVIVCHSCNKVAGRSYEDKCTSCNMSLKE